MAGALTVVGVGRVLDPLAPREVRPRDVNAPVAGLPKVVAKPRAVGPGDAPRPYVVVAPEGPKTRPTKVHGPRDVAKPVAGRDLHASIRARVAETARQVRPSSNGTPQGRRRGGRPRTSDGPAAQDGRERGRPRDTVREATRPAPKVLAGRVAPLVPLTAEPDVRLVAIKVMAASLEERQAGEVEVSRGPAPAPIKP